MAQEDIITSTGVTVTHDETAGLQNGVATPAPAGDADDDDVLVASIPSAFATRLAALTSATAIGAAESDGNVVTINPTGISNIALTDASGDPLDGDSSGLFTTDGDEIFLFTDTNDNIVLGKTAAGDIVFAIYLEETGGPPATGAKLWTVQYEAIDHGDDGNDHDSAVDLSGLVHVTASGSQSFGFAGAPSGQNLFMMFGNSSQAIVATGRDPANQSEGESIVTGDTVNTGQAGGSTTLGTNGQQIKAQNGMYFTFVTGANTDFTVPNLSQNEADVEANIAFTGVIDTNQAQFTIAQTTPAKTTLSIKISAFTTDAESGTAFVDGLSDDVAVNILSVQVNGVTVAADLTGDTAIVSGVKAKDVITYTTEGTHNRVLIENNQPASGPGSNRTFDIGAFTLTQVAGDTDEIGSKILFEDDGPVIDLTSLEPSIVVDESVGADAGDPNADDETDPDAPLGAIGYAEVAAASLFSETADAGSDGEASKVYSLVLTAGATGLTDTASGEAVVLVDNAGVIEGRTETGDDLVFTISVDADTGDVTVAQFRALDHGDDGNDHDSAVSLPSGLIELEATLTDGDTDTASDKVELGSLVDFEDDGPTIDLTSLEPAIVVDESVGADAGDPNADDETDPDAPLGAIGFAQITAASLFTETADAGSDGEASKVYSLVLTAGATGLTDTASGEAVVLVDNAGVIEGRTETGDALVFTISVDADTGDVTVAQFRALDHGDDGNDHDSAVSMASGLIELEATLTDGDTDTASDKIELGSLVDFEDDGPTIDLTSLEPAIVLDESVGADAGDPNADDETDPDAPVGAIGFAEIAAASLFTETADAGSDGEASKVYSLVLTAGAAGLTDTASGEAVVLSQPLAGGTVEGRTETGGDLVFTISVDPDTGDVTVAQFRALDHGDDGNDHDSAVSMASGLVELQATLTDGDTDTASDSIELGSLVDFEDDGPTIDLTSLEPAIVVDESVGADAGDPNADDEDDPAAPVGTIGFAVVAAALLFTETADAGSDGEAAKAYSLVLTAGSTGLTDTASGEAVVLVDNAGVIEGRTETGDELVFTISVDADTGNVTVAQYRALDHGDDGNDHDSAASMASGLVELQATLTDGDTDTASDKIELGSLIDFEDDGPVMESVTDDVIVNFAASASDGDSDLGLDYGSDGAGSLTITSFEAMPDDTVLGTITETLSAGDTVLTYSSDLFGDLFQLTLDGTEPGAYTFTVLQDAPLVLNVLDFGGNDPGGPVEEITITAPGDTDVTFDGFLITDFSADIKPQFAAGDLEPPDPDEADDDVNVSTQGIGLADNQMDPLEALLMSFDPDVEGVQVTFEGATGGGNTFRIKVEGYDANGVLVFEDLVQEAAPKGNAVLTKEYLFDEPVDEFYIALDFDTSSSGVRISQVATISRAEVPDFELDFTVTAMDGDTDTTTTDFTVGIDGNGDGLIEVA